MPQRITTENAFVFNDAELRTIIFALKWVWTDSSDRNTQYVASRIIKDMVSDDEWEAVKDEIAEIRKEAGDV